MEVSKQTGFDKTSCLEAQAPYPKNRVPYMYMDRNVKFKRVDFYLNKKQTKLNWVFNVDVLIWIEVFPPAQKKTQTESVSAVI